MATSLTIKKYSKTAFVSFIFGIAAISLILLPAVSIIFQILAIGLGAFGIFEAKTIKRSGIRFAISGLILAIIALILTISTSLLALIGAKIFASIIYIFVTFTELF